MSRTIESGDTQIISVQSAAGFSPGDYIYATRSGYAPLSSVPINAMSTVIAGVVTPVTAATTSVSSLIGPTTVSGTFSGTTTTPMTVVSGPTTPATSSSGAIPLICALTGGNFVVVRTGSSSSGNIFGTVYSSAGAVVVAETLLASAAYSGGTTSGLAITATPDNGFALAWYNSLNYLSVGKFTATLTTSWTVSPSYSNAGIVRIACNAGGNIFITFGLSSNAYYAVFSSTGAVVKSSTLFGGSSTHNTAFNTPCIAGTNGDFYAVSLNSGTSTAQISRYDSSGTYISNTQFGYSYSYPSLVAYPSGNIGYAYLSGGAVYIASYTPVFAATSMIISPSPIGTSASYPIAGSNWVYATDPVNDRVVGLFGNSSSYATAFTQTSASAATSTGTVSTLGTNTANYSSCSLGVNGTFGVVTADSGGGTNRIYFVYATPTTYTNGSTAVSGTVSYPTNTFLGVAVTACSAGGTGKVLVKGTTNVSASYGSASSLLGFDLTSSGSPTANKGTISGRTITLQGF